jgi:hypothetical protein
MRSGTRRGTCRVATRGGASKMHAEDIKRWLRSITLEEDPKKGPDNVVEGNNWHLLVSLIEVIWTQGKIPQ